MTQRKLLAWVVVGTVAAGCGSYDAGVDGPDAGGRGGAGKIEAITSPLNVAQERVLARAVAIAVKATYRRPPRLGQIATFPSVAGLPLVSSHGTDPYMDVYYGHLGDLPENGVWIPHDPDPTLVLAIRGTNVLNPYDVWADVRSQVPTTHKNSLFQPARVSPLGWVGSGFESRAAFLEGALKAILDDRLLDVKGQPTRKLRVIVAGHSLGAVVTELVAYDINEYLKAQNALYPGLAMNQSRYSVLAYTFNAPMVGPHATVVNYRQVLAASVDVAGENQDSLRLAQFTRQRDIVESVPLGYEHPVWSPNAPPQDGANPSYYPHAEAPYASWWNPLGNHDMGQWIGWIDGLDDTRITNLFRLIAMGPVNPPHNAGGHIHLADEACAAPSSVIDVHATSCGVGGDGVRCGCGTLRAGDKLRVGEVLRSCDGVRSLALGADGELTLTQGTSVLWKAGAAGRGATSASMQDDGALVLLKNDGTRAWSTNTAGAGCGATFSIAGTSPVVLGPSGAQIWSPQVLGCYADSTTGSNRDLPAPLHTPATNTPSSCVATCLGAGYAYAGVQYGNQCWCGNTFGSYGTSTACTMACSGDATKICGGFNANNIYATGVPSTRVAASSPGAYVSDSTWKRTEVAPSGSAWTTPYFDDGLWLAAVDEGAPSTSPWGVAPTPAGSAARWIWSYDSRASGDTKTIYFRKTFVANASAYAVLIKVDNSFTAYLNGTLIASGGGWTGILPVVVATTPGQPYALAIKAVNAGGPGGLLVDASPVVGATNASWRQTAVAPTGMSWARGGFDDTAWAPAVDEGPYGTAPWGTSPALAATTPARWIWSYDSRNSGDTQTLYLRQPFVAQSSLYAVSMSADNLMNGYLDGNAIVSGPGTTPHVATIATNPGQTYTLGATVTNQGGPGGLIGDVQPIGPDTASAAWRFEEATGAAAVNEIDPAGDGTIAGATRASGVACRDGGCLQLAGAGAITAPYTPGMKFGTGDFTIAAWARTTSGNPEVVVVGPNRCNISESWLLSFTAGKAAFATFGAGSTGVYIKSSASFNDGLWHQLTAVRNGTAITLYVDGLAVATGAVSASYNSDAGGTLLTMGNLNGCAGREFAGAIDAVQLFPRAFTATQVAALATNPVMNLSNIGANDFRVSFTISTAQAGLVAVVEQRATCSHGMFWGVRMRAGYIAAETDDGVRYSEVTSTAKVNDGAPHHVVVERSSGTLGVTVDGVLSSSAPSATILGQLSPLTTGTDPCVGVYSITALVGSLTNLRITGP